MVHLGLFEGIGGFSLAAKWLGWQTVAWCEINPFSQRVLVHHFSSAESFKDITKADLSGYANKVDALSGGWPCQRYSVAGDRRGEEPLKEDLIRIVQQVKAPWLVLENVYNFLSEQFAGEHDGLCMQLEHMGYELQTFDIDAASCGLPTVERHIWIVASSDCFRQQRRMENKIQNKPVLQRQLQGSYQREDFRWHLPESRVHGLGKGFPDELSGITLSKWHTEAIRSLGNAIPPPVAYEIFKVIDEIESKTG